MAVTVDDLKKIYSSSLSDEQLAEALETAQLVVDEDIKPNCSMSDERYDRITLYLAAHYASITETTSGGQAGALRRSKLGDADESYATPPDSAFGYECTRWGQMAIALDKCGILAGQQANKGLKAELRVV